MAYLALRHTLLGGRVLRSQDQPGLEQEMWALLALYQALRRAMVTAAETVPGTDPDRASFTIALETARQTLSRAAGVITDDASLTGRIGQAVLGGLLPPRRPRVSAPKSNPAIALEQSRPAPAPPQYPGHRPDRHRQRPRDEGSIRDTPGQVLDRHARPLTTRP